MSQVQPTDFISRTNHYRTLINEGASFNSLGDTSIVSHYGVETSLEIQQAKKLGIADLSPVSRTGFKGPEAINWARSQGLTIGEYNNRIYSQGTGAIVARLADSEIIILNNPLTLNDQCSKIDLEYKNSQPSKCYSVPRLHSSAWFLISGQCASAMFAKICAVDLRLNKFPLGAIAQTSIARINGIIIRGDIRDTPAFHLLFDSASADYMWTCLKDAFIEFDGTPVGYNALNEL